MSLETNNEKQLMDLDAADHKLVQENQRKLDKIQPKFNDGFRDCLQREALIKAWDTVDVPHEFSKAFIANLQEEQKSAIAGLINLTTGIMQEIETIKQRIFQRNSLVSAAGASWIGKIIKELEWNYPSNHTPGLQAAGQQCQDSQDLAEIIAILKNTVERVKEIPQDLALLNLDRVITKALALDSEAA